MKLAPDNTRSWRLRRRQVPARLFGAAMAGVALAMPLAALADDRPLLTISTNNTPLDRKALQALSEEAGRRAGIDVKFVSLPSERSLVAANQGEVDGEGLRVAGLDDSYGNLVRVPERYVSISFVAFAKDPSLSVAKGWDILKSQRVAFIHGWKMFESNAAGARVVNKVDKAEQLFQMLEQSRIDLALYTLADGIALARKMGLQGGRRAEADPEGRRHVPLPASQARRAGAQARRGTASDEGRRQPPAHPGRRRRRRLTPLQTRRR